MFNLSAAIRCYRWPVDVRVPIDGGRHTTMRFKASFRVLPQDRQEELQRQAETRGGALPLQSAEDGFNVKLLREVLVDWEDVLDGDPPAQVALIDPETGRFTEPGERAIQTPFIQAALVTAYFDSILGKRYVAKN
jgi:hypothetical protein